MWLAAGFVLLVLELATPSGFFIMFFGVGAILTGVLASVGLLDQPRRPVVRLHRRVGR